MFNPQVKAGKQILAYKQWIIEQKFIGQVIPLEFINFKFSRRSNSNKPVPFNKSGQSFIGENWKCLDKDGNFITVTFKQDIGADYRNNSSLTINKNPIEDGWIPNLLIDRYEEYIDNMVNKNKYPNKLLSTHIKWHRKRLDAIKYLLDSSKDPEEKQLLFYLLRHKQSPTIATLRSVQNIRAEKSELYINCIDRINNYLKYEKSTT